MKKVILDLEFNPIAKKDREEQKIISNEIIEFGAVMIDKDGNVLGQFQKFVKPRFALLAPRISRLTGITDEMLAEAEVFADVFAAFLLWLGAEDYEIYSWSMSDFRQLRDEADAKLAYPADTYLFSHWHDTQKEFSDKLGYQGIVSLKTAMSAIDQGFEGKAHDALADAENTAGLVALMVDEKKFNQRTGIIQDLFSEKEGFGNVLGSMFADFFNQLVVAG